MESEVSAAGLAALEPALTRSALSLCALRRVLRSTAEGASISSSSSSSSSRQGGASGTAAPKRKRASGRGKGGGKMLDIDVGALKRRHVTLIPRSSRQISLVLNDQFVLDVWCVAGLGPPPLPCVSPVSYSLSLSLSLSVCVCARMVALLLRTCLFSASFCVAVPRRFLDSGDALLKDCGSKGKVIPSLVAHQGTLVLPSAELPAAFQQMMGQLD